MYTLRRQVGQEFDALVLTVPVVALFPGLAAITHAPAYWGPKGAIAYVVGYALFLFVMRWKVLPRAAAWGKRVQVEHAELAARLGREPTPEELLEFQRR
jgi:hypothetical protein